MPITKICNIHVDIQNLTGIDPVDNRTVVNVLRLSFFGRLYDVTEVTTIRRGKTNQSYLYDGIPFKTQATLVKYLMNEL